MTKEEFNILFDKSSPRGLGDNKLNLHTLVGTFYAVELLSRDAESVTCSYKQRLSILHDDFVVKTLYMPYSSIILFSITHPYKEQN